MEAEETLARAVTALERHLVEQNELRAESNRLYEQHLALEHRRVELAEESNRLYLRSVTQQEENGRNYKQRLVEQRKASRWALVILALLLVGLFVFTALFPAAHHAR